MPKLSRHHIIPVSRFRGQRTKHRQSCLCRKCKGNTVLIPKNFHNAWHLVFGALTPKESEDFVHVLTEMMYISKRIDWQDIFNLRQQLKERYSGKGSDTEAEVND